MSSYSKAYRKPSRSHKGKQREDNPHEPAAPKAGPSTAVTPGAKGLPDPGIFQTRPSRPLHTSPSFERGRRSSQHGYAEPEATSARVTGAGGRGEASYSLAGSQNAAPWGQSSSGSGSGSGSGSSDAPGPSRRRTQAHPADTRDSEAWRAMGDSYVHANDPGFWRERRMSEEAARRRARRRRGESEQARGARGPAESCLGCVLL